MAGAIRAVRPYGVDLCTGVRTDGVLDEGELARFMVAVTTAGEKSGRAEAGRGSEP